MYIRKIEITNIKGVQHFTMDFGDVTKPGWHVLIGDNGSGKTTILKAIGMTLLNDRETSAISIYNGHQTIRWIGKGNVEAKIRVWPYHPDEPKVSSMISQVGFALVFNPEYGLLLDYPTDIEDSGLDSNKLWEDVFSSGYGPFRRLTGRIDSFFQSGQRANFATLFSEEEGLPQTQTWLKDLEIDSRSDPAKADELQFVINFINSSRLLPDGATLTNKIDSQGIKIKDAAGNEIYFRDASDGYRSILSLTLDLIKNMIAHYGIEKVMQNATATQIKLPGVVLIDEVDAHLHPNWQVRIGKWFTDFFPEIQFIVTTHSPLICRGSLNGQIWHLKTPGSGEESGPVTELQRKRLVYGDVMDAYGTEVFGKGITSSANSEKDRKELTRLHKKSVMGTISAKEVLEMEKLEAFLKAF
jgi:energy-coupling factor transporter ATP-binding protein EcfA2